MSIYSIYKITNSQNQKSYIGFTSNISLRFYRHRNAKNNSALHLAIKKYGIEKFTFEIIYQSLDKMHTLNIMEPYFIDLYKSYGRLGYNLTLGGEAPMLGRNHNDKFKKDMSVLFKNKTRSKETCIKISKGLQGRKLSEEHKKHLKQSKAKTYIIYFSNGTNLTVTNLKQFAKENNYNQGNLSSLLHDKINHYKDIIKITFA